MNTSFYVVRPKLPEECADKRDEAIIWRIIIFIDTYEIVIFVCEILNYTNRPILNRRKAGEVRILYRIYAR